MRLICCSLRLWSDHILVRVWPAIRTQPGTSAKLAGSCKLCHELIDHSLHIPAWQPMSGLPLHLQWSGTEHVLQDGMQIRSCTCTA